MITINSSYHLIFQEYTWHFLRKRSGVGVEDEGLQGDGKGETTTAILGSAGFAMILLVTLNN